MVERWLSWSILALTLSVGASAQDKVGSISGIVNDKDFEEPLGGATVRLRELDQKVETTEQGHYVFGQVPAGRYTVEFSKDGYVRQVKSDVVVNAGQLTDVDVWLSGDFTDMDEFVVQDVLQLGTGTEAGLLQLRFESPSLMDSISADLIGRAGASDAASALRLVAGASLQDGKSAVIRGLPDRYVSSQLNGVRLPTADEDKRAVDLDQFPSAVIESLQVSKTFTPDQQGDASGGAVNVQLDGVPDKPFFFEIKAETKNNTQTTGNNRFLSYQGGGVNYLGQTRSGRGIQTEKIGESWEGAVGVSREEAPVNYKWSAAGGGMHDFDGFKIGGFASVFYDRDSSFHDNGIDDQYWVEGPGNPMTPQKVQFHGAGDYKTQLFDVTQGTQSVQWGGLATIGAEIENHKLSLTYLYTRSAEDKATLAEDTRGKQYFFPGYDPNDPSSPGYKETEAAPYLRLETLDYTERTTETVQFKGHHRFPIGELGPFRAPEFDWSYARSSATLYQPDKRQFSSQWKPGRVVGPLNFPPTHEPFKPSANFTLGNLQRIWKRIYESSDQYAADVKLPFEQWSDRQGYMKVGLFHDDVKRRFNQDTFANFEDNSTYSGQFGQFWSQAFPFENHPITASEGDVDYDGRQRIAALYGMMDLPVTSMVSVIGGARLESTEISIVNDPEAEATWFPTESLSQSGSGVNQLTQTTLNPGDGDVTFKKDNVLPSLALLVRPLDGLTLRASYNETVARQTFKELSPILQQEYLGGPIFVGNPGLQMSKLRNYDLRADYTPYDGGLFSASWFRKDIDDPIEYVQRVANFTFTTPLNFPSGRLSGYELETRQNLGALWEPLGGLSVGANATFIDSKVQLPESESAIFNQPSIKAPQTSRDMTNAPDHLYNLYATYDIEATGTKLGAFYTAQGDTLVAGATQSNGNFIPSVYATEFDTLNLSLTQRLSQFVNLKIQAKNVTNPEIKEVYRSEYIGADVLKTSYTKGIDYTIALGGEFKF